MLWLSAPIAVYSTTGCVITALCLTLCQRLSTVTRHIAAEGHDTGKACVEEVDNRVNFPFFQGIALWTTVDGRPCRAQPAVTATGIPFKTLVPETGSKRSSSVSTFELTPAYSPATDNRVPATECPTRAAATPRQA